MEEKNCCVTGHREIPADKLDYVKRELEREVRAALEDGCRTFFTGFAEGVDILFGWCVDAQRENYPDIFLEAAIPYPGRVDQLKKDGKKLLKRCDGINIVCPKYERDCFFQRNRYMVRQSGRVIAVYDGRAGGGTFYTMDYARTMGRDLRIIQL